MDSLKKIESLEQINHDLQRKLSVKELMEKELKEELSLLEDLLKKEKTNIDEKNNDIKSLKAQMSKLQHDLEDEKTKFHTYKENFVPVTEAESTPTLATNHLNNSIDKHLEEAFEDQKVEIENLRLSSQTYKNRCNEAQNENMHLKRKIKDLQIELEEKQNLLQLKTETLNEVKEDREILREKNVLMESELLALRSAPSDLNSKGNSLFAEVEDNRKLLVAKLKDTQSRYAMAKKTLVAKNLEVSRLREQHILVYREWNDIKEEKLKNDSRLESAHLARIEDLERELKQIKGEQTQTLGIDQQDEKGKWVHELLESKRKEMENLRKEFQARSLKEWTLQRNLHQLKSELLALKRKLVEKNVTESNDNEKSRRDTSLKPVVNNEKCVLKENVHKRTITFSEES